MATWQDVVDLALAYPGVEEAVSYGEPSLKVRKSLVARWRVADDSIVLLDVDRFERDHLLAQEPEVYFLEPHYQPHEIVLARLPAADLAAIAMYVERRWRNVAPRKLIAERDRH
jgi:hypothetical protein